MSVLASPFSSVQNAPLRSKLLLAITVLVACAIPFIVPPFLFVLAVVGIPAALVVIYVLSCTLRGFAEPILLGWVLLFPLGYYFASYPKEHPIITLDRVFIALLIVAIALSSAKEATVTPQLLRKAAIAWVAYVAAVGVSLIRPMDTLYSLRVALDALVLPAFLAWYVIRNFQIRRSLRTLHLLLSIMSIYMAAIGAAEMVLHEDLLPCGAYDLTFTGTSFVVRANGPLPESHAFGLIGMLTFCLLIFVYRVAGDELPRWQRVLHFLAVVSAIACGLMPLFRSLMLALLVVALLDLHYRRLFRGRAAVISAILAVFAVFFILKSVSPEAYEDRADSMNLYARVAQQKQTIDVFLLHPLRGVGFGYFNSAAVSLPVDLYEFRGQGALNGTHNNLGAVLAESGLLAFIPFFASQILLVMAFLRMKKLKPRDGAMVWPFFLYAFLFYWFLGLDLGSYTASDIGLWFMFTVACLYKYALTEPPPPRSAGLAERGTV